MSPIARYDNSDLATKLALRRYFLDKYLAGRRFSVLDCCAGESGAIWGQLRQEYDCEYLGLDKKPLSRPGVLKMDSVRWLREVRADYDVVDIDTYGEPWEHYWAWAEKPPQMPCLVFLTYGFVNTALGVTSKRAQVVAGIPESWEVPMLKNNRDFVVSSCLTMGCGDAILPLEARKVVGKRGAVLYFGLAFGGKPDVAQRGVRDEGMGVAQRQLRQRM